MTFLHRLQAGDRLAPSDDGEPFATVLDRVEKISKAPRCLGRRDLGHLIRLSDLAKGRRRCTRTEPAQSPAGIAGGADRAVNRAVDSEKPMRRGHCWQFEAASRLGEHPALLTAPAVSDPYLRYDEERHVLAGHNLTTCRRAKLGTGTTSETSRFDRRGHTDDYGPPPVRAVDTGAGIFTLTQKLLSSSREIIDEWVIGARFSGPARRGIPRQAAIAPRLAATIATRSRSLLV